MSTFVWRQGVTHEHWFGEFSGVSFSVRRDTDGFWAYWCGADKQLTITQLAPNYELEKLKQIVECLVVGTIISNLQEIGALP